MDRDARLVEAAVAAFQERLMEAMGVMRACRTARGFLDVERMVHDLTRELADQLTAQVLEEIVADKQRAQDAVARVRDLASKRGIDMLFQGSRMTPVRLLGGTTVRLKTVYTCAKPRGDEPRDSRGKAGTGVFPVLDELGITDKSTPALRLRVGHAVCEANSFADARELLRQNGLDITHRVALRLTYAVSVLALKVRTKAVRSLRAGNDEGIFVGRDVVACVDGGRCKVRQALRGRPPKGGRRKFKVDWKEPRVITLYVLDGDGKRDKKAERIIDGTMGDADDTFALLLYHLRRVGAHRARSLTFVADGAKWIWKRTAELAKQLDLPDEIPVTEIVDYYHVVERLSDFASNRRGWSDKRAKRWVAQQKNRLKRGWAHRILRSIQELLTKGERKKGKERKYWTRNLPRLDYKKFREAGLPLGSGAVESAVRRVINMRVKSPGTCWREDHVEGIIHLRAHSKAGRWTDIEDAIVENSAWKPKARRRRAS